MLLKKNKELQIGDRVPIIRLMGKSNGCSPELSTDGKVGEPKINGKHTYQRAFIKRIGWEYYQGLDDDGHQLWEVELDNCDEDDYRWYMGFCTNFDNFTQEGL